jgi:hypothetical protein
LLTRRSEPFEEATVSLAVRSIFQDARDYCGVSPRIPIGYTSARESLLNIERTCSFPMNLEVPMFSKTRMTADTSELQAITERLERLERQNHALKRAGIGALAIFGAALLMGQGAPAPRTVEAQKFVLRDSSGRVRADLSMLPGNPTLRLFDAEGKMQAQFSSYRVSFISLPFSMPKDPADPSAGKIWIPGETVNLSNTGLDVWEGSPDDANPLHLVNLEGGKYPSLHLHGADGKSNLILDTSGGASVRLTGKDQPAVTLSSDTDGADLDLFDANGKPRAMLTLLKDRPFLSLSDGSGNVRADLSASNEGPSLDLNDASGSAGVHLELSNDGEPVLCLGDAAGFETDIGSTSLVTPLTGETHKTSAASVVMFGNGKEHKVIWQAPESQ